MNSAASNDFAAGGYLKGHAGERPLYCSPQLGGALPGTPGGQHGGQAHLERSRQLQSPDHLQLNDEPGRDTEASPALTTADAALTNPTQLTPACSKAPCTAAVPPEGQEWRKLDANLAVFPMAIPMCAATPALHPPCTRCTLVT